ncbi:hypothetical protein D9M68_987090 [compost metagenome]
MTLLPPTHSTSPIAAKNEKVMALVLRTRTSTRSCASSSASFDATSNLSSSKFWPEKARTTRMPPRFSSITRDSAESLFCSTTQVARSVNWATDERHATKGTKLNASRPSTTSVVSNI